MTPALKRRDMLALVPLVVSSVVGCLVDRQSADAFETVLGDWKNPGRIPAQTRSIITDRVSQTLSGSLPPVINRGTVYLLDWSGTIHALFVIDGTLQWAQEYSGSADVSRSFADQVTISDGTLYVSSFTSEHGLWRSISKLERSCGSIDPIG